MAIIQSLPLGGSGSTYTNMTTDEAIAGTNTEKRVISAKVLNDAIDNKIPTVNNATLTIQKNGTTVQSFTANASTNVTANITVPTKVSDLTNDSGFLTTHQDISGKADKSTTLSGYGITDAYTKTQVDNKISNLVNSAPETLDTLNELASALGNDPNFATTVANQIGNKANDSDVVHKSGDETIAGNKTFSGTTRIDGYEITFADNRTTNVWGKIPVIRENDGLTELGQYVDFHATKNDTLDYCIRLRAIDSATPTIGKGELRFTGGSITPNTTNATDLGSSSLKWKDVYATTLHGDVDFPITDAQIAAIVV